MPTPRQTGLPGLPGLRSTHPAAISRRRGGLYGRPDRTPGISGLSVIATQLWRHVGMPPYGVRRGCGGKCRHFGRICNPPLQVRSLPFPAVGAHYICARDALPGLSGLRSTGPGRGGMWACRPTRFDEGAAENAGFSGGYSIRPYGCTSAGSRCRGALYMRPGRTAGIVGLAVHRTRSWRHVGMPPYGVRRGCGAKRGLLGRLIAAPTAVDGGAVGIMGLLGRPYRPPLRVYARRFSV